MSDRELCPTCEGNGVIKIPGGVATCSACDGACWKREPLSSSSSSAVPLTVEEIAAQLADRIELEGSTWAGGITDEGRAWIVDALRAAESRGAERGRREALEELERETHGDECADPVMEAGSGLALDVLIRTRAAQEP